MKAKPKPPTWGDRLFRRIPGRLSRGQSLSGED